jgi:hypothetical protein
MEQSALMKRINIDKQLRELKSIYMTANAFLVKLILHGCHLNKANSFNQVSLLGLNFLGQSLETINPAYLDQTMPLAHTLKPQGIQ